MKEMLRNIIVWCLTLEARAVLRTYHPAVIVVTGSVGKTSAKDAIYTALKNSKFVRKSEKSFNSDIGAPLTILGIPNGWSNPIRWLRNVVDGFLLLLVRVPYPEWLVVEVGADRPGDISKSLAWLKPRVVVATRFPAVPVHVEFYESPEEVQQEELAPLSWLMPGGVFVGNADDELVQHAAVPEGVEKILYGIGEHADLKASRIKVLTTKGVAHGTSFDVAYKGERAHVVLDGVVGATHIYASLAGIGSALATDVPLATAAQAFESHITPPGRLKLIAGINKSTLIDDTYNSSPVAVEEALKTLATIPHQGKRIAVLGDMLELGAYSVSEHERVGRAVPEAADLLVTVGMRARKIGESALKSGMAPEQVLEFDRASDAAEHLAGIVGAGDVVLLKGSQGVRMERATKQLMARPDRAPELLCRQDAEWLVR